MFALEDPEETTALLEAAGFADVGFEPFAPTVLSVGAARSVSRWTSSSRWGWSEALSAWQTERDDELVEGLRSSLTGASSPVSVCG